MIRRLANLVLVLALLGINSNQAVTKGYFYSNIGTQFAWSGSAQSSWNGSSVAATCGDYNAYIRNDGTTCSANTLVQYGFATAHAVVSNVHTPILANNSFAGGSFASWSSTNASACSGALFNSVSGGDEDGNNGFANASSLACIATPAQVTLAQTFTTGGAPTSQTYSFWYRATQAVSGDSTCTQAFGAVSISAKIGSTNIASVGTPNLDGNWHQVSGSMSAMVSGSNTLTVTATLTAARGQYSRYDSRIGDYVCTGGNTVAQQIQIDNLVLSGVW